MSDEIKDEKKDQEQEKDIDYIEAIKKLKDNSVPKDEYEKIQQEKKDLLKALVEGEQLEKKAGEPAKKSASDLRKEFFNGSELNNLDYVSKALELRQAVIDEGGLDPFLPTGQKIAPTYEDVEAANRVAEAFQSCIEYADGDSEIFTQELQRITKDIAPMIKRR